MKEKTKTKRVVSLIVSILMILSLASSAIFGGAFAIKASAFAAGTCGDEIAWILDNQGTLRIIGTGSMDSYLLVNNVPWSDYKDEIINAVVEDGITSIGNRMFYECRNLETVVIGDSVEKIGDAAFYDCKSLSIVTFGNGLKTIGTEAFENCSAITNLELPNGLTEIGMLSFFGCKSLTSVSMPESVAKVRMFAFSNCGELQDVYYTGTEEQWKGLSLDWTNSPLKNADVHFIGETEHLFVEGSVYSLSDGYLLGIAPYTLYEDFTAQFTVEVTVYDAYGDEIDSGYIGTGFVASFGESGAVAVVSGDVTGDGEIDSSDAVSVLKYDSGLIELEGVFLLAADVTGSGEVDSDDATFILKYDSGLIEY